MNSELGFHALLLSIISVLSSIFLLSSIEPSFPYITIKFSVSDLASAFTPVPSSGNMSGITVDTDKSVYVAGESVVVDGRVDNVIPSERVRIDFYDPTGKPISVASFTEPNEEGHSTKVGQQ